jgi:hypothetical protein
VGIAQALFPAILGDYVVNIVIVIILYGLFYEATTCQV